MKKLIAAEMLIGVAALTATASGNAASPEIKVEYLGTNNTLVRVDTDKRYIILPVQESNDDAKINILVDGKLARSINVKLAKTKVDYTVPLDLTPYRGHEVILNVMTSQNRQTVREAKEDVCWNNFTVSDTFDTANREHFRPLFHHTPLYGWMNDPNGMFYKDGEWHLYYQWNPFGSKWNNISWGHSSSSDLVNWKHHEAPLLPDGLGMIFSGSCAVDSMNTAGFGPGEVIALYTSADMSQVQSMAHSSNNGLTFTTYAGNPVIALESEARDPNMFRNSRNNEWNLILAHPLEHEMLIFASPDLKNWTLRSAFGKGLGAQDGVWECPDLFELPVAGTDRRKWVLVCNLNPGGIFGGSATQYFIGDFDGTTFTPDRNADGTVPTKWMDFGKDHYATVSWSDAPDKRRTMIGWMSNWQYAAEVPTRQFRSANTLPREIGLFTHDGGIYTSVTPSPELESMRLERTLKVASTSVGAKGKRFALPAKNDGICEILLDINPQKASDITLTLANAAGRKVTMTYNPAEASFSFDRTQSGITDFSQDFPAVTAAPTFNNGKKLSLRIFIDRSSIEVFEQSGRFAMTNLVFPEEPYTSLTVTTEGGKAEISNLSIYSLKPSV